MFWEQFGYLQGPLFVKKHQKLYSLLRVSINHHSQIINSRSCLLIWLVGLVILNWCVILVLLVFVVLAFDPSGAKPALDMDMDYDRFQQAVLHGDNRRNRIWERRCRFLLCSCSGGDEVHRNAFRVLLTLI